MKKIGIITIYDEDNYGNRLQNYAVQEILKSLGFEVETIKNINIVDNINYLEEAKKVLPERREKFLEFNKNINISKDTIFHDRVPENFHEQYDYFVIGSDQIWNSAFPDRFSDFVFANFAPTEKRIAFSASFGVDDIQDNNLYKMVKEIKHISVREDAGKEILQKKFGIDNVQTLIDPTMMLSSSDWENVMQRPKELEDKKYILKYFLGPVNSERENEIQKLAKEKDYEIIDLMDKSGKFYATGPSEFIYLIKNSEIVLTDSFHSCVFSIIFKKPFLYFYREGNLKNINSRLETLFRKFKITDRIYNGKISENNLKFDINVKDIIKKEQDKTVEFLKEALDMVEVYSGN